VKTYLLTIIFSAILSLQSAMPLPVLRAEEHLQVITSDFPPYNYVENQVPKGFCTEIVLALLKETGHNVPITTLPWARAYQTALKYENTLIYTIARTPERESDFLWVRLVVSAHPSLFSLKNNPIHLTALEDARAHLIGTSRNDSRLRFLQNQGITNLELATHARMNAVKLINHRITLWAEDELAAIYTLKQMGMNPDQTIKKALELNIKLDGYLAFSKKTPLKLVEKFATALKRIKESGSYTQIKNKYILDNPAQD